jgi:hypothetical protein
MARFINTNIFANRDWLVCNFEAATCWVSFLACRVDFSNRLAASRVSMNSISASDNWRKS